MGRSTSGQGVFPPLLAGRSPLLGPLSAPYAPPGSFPQKGCESRGFPSGKHDGSKRPIYRVNATVLGVRLSGKRDGHNQVVLIK